MIHHQLFSHQPYARCVFGFVFRRSEWIGTGVDEFIGWLLVDVFFYCATFVFYKKCSLVISYKEGDYNSWTNPWPAIPACWHWCRNADAGLKQLTIGKKCRCQTNFFRHSGFPAFRYLPSSRVFTLHLDVHGVSLSPLIKFCMPKWPASGHPVTVWTKKSLSEPVRYLTKWTQSILSECSGTGLRCRMPMPVASVSIPVSSNGGYEPQG